MQGATDTKWAELARVVGNTSISAGGVFRGKGERGLSELLRQGRTKAEERMKLVKQFTKMDPALVRMVIKESLRQHDLLFQYETGGLRWCLGGWDAPGEAPATRQ